MGCTPWPDEDDDPEVDEVDVADGKVPDVVVPTLGAIARIVGAPEDDSPSVTVGVASAPSAEDAGPELPPLAANAAAAAPPITAERMNSFLCEDFFFRTLLCGINTLDAASL